MTPAQFIEAVAPGARASHAQTGIPASFIIAQAAVESGWGSSGLTEKARNLFGIKAYPGWSGQIYSMPTMEDDGGSHIEQAAFCCYDTWEDSIAGQAAFLHGNLRYAPAFACTDDPVAFAQAIQAAGYSTNPHYASLIVSIINFHNLTQFDA